MKEIDENGDGEIDFQEFSLMARWLDDEESNSPHFTQSDFWELKHQKRRKVKTLAQEWVHATL